MVFANEITITQMMDTFLESIDEDDSSGSLKLKLFRLSLILMDLVCVVFFFIDAFGAILPAYFIDTIDRDILPHLTSAGYWVTLLLPTLLFPYACLPTEKRLRWIKKKDESVHPDFQ